MAKERYQPLEVKKAKILYDAAGNPEYALVPLKDQAVYTLTDEQIVAAVDDVREELFRKHGRAKTERSS